MKVIEEAKSIAGVAAGGLIGALLAVPIAIAQLVMLPFGKPTSAVDLAEFLRDCVEGTLNDAKIDSMSGVKFSDPRLRQIMIEFGQLPDDWTSPLALEKLESLQKRALIIAATTNS